MDGTRTDERRVRWAAAAGTTAPLWFWLTLVVLALLHGRIDVSGHELLPYGFLMYLGFFAYGALTLAFVWGLSRRVPRSGTSVAALIALTIFGCGPLLAVFTTDSEQGPPQTVHGALHFAGFLVVALVPIIALPLFAAAVRRDLRWRPLAAFSLIAAIVVVLDVFLPSMPADGYALWSGPGSLADIALIGIWQIVVSRRLARLADRGAVEVAEGTKRRTDPALA